MMNKSRRNGFACLAIGVATSFAGCVGSVEESVGTPAGGVAANPEIPGDEVLRPIEACGGTPNPGRVLVHRLNRVEYNNTIRDLLGNNSRPADEFAADIPLGGFDNNSFSLNLDPGLLRQYGGAAQRLARNAVIQPGFISCDPGTLGDVACARKVLEPFVRRAWRRPASAEEIDGLVSSPGSPLQVAKGTGDAFVTGVALAVEVVLSSPHFLYRFEIPPSPGATGPYSLNAYSLASRLSYFLWSSMPDDPLLAAAASGELLKAEGLSAQVTRMLADKKAGALAENLSGQWLGGRTVVGAEPSATKFPPPKFDNALLASIPTETSLFVNAFVKDNLDLRGLLDANFTFVNKRLAQHYRISDATVTGANFVRVDLSNNEQRGGVLTQSTYLIATSKPDEPVIPRRGKWVLANLLCRPPPSAPPEANAEQEKIEKALGPNPTRRQVAEARDAKPYCNTCHAAFDPIGLALDKYDAIGAWRGVDDQKRTIVADGTLNGRTFHTPRQMAQVIKDDPGLPACLTNVLFRYALGRVVADSDQCLLDDIAKRAVDKLFGAQDVIAALVASPAFRFQSE